MLTDIHHWFLLYFTFENKKGNNFSRNCLEAPMRDGHSWTLNGKFYVILFSVGSSAMARWAWRPFGLLKLA